VLPVPDPGLGVDRLADRAQDPQRRQVELRGDVIAPLHEGADGGGSGVEEADAVFLDDLPEAALVRGVGGALVHHLRRAIGERAVDDVGVAGDPADVGGAPVDVGLGLEVEDGVVGVARLGEVAAGGVQDALGLTRGAGGVEDEQRVLCLEGLGGVLGGLAADHVVPPHVAALVEGGLLARTAHDEDMLDLRALGDGLVDGRLEGGGLAAPVAAVGGDDELGVGVLDTGGDGLGREAAEDHRVGRADTGAGQHRHRRLGDHRQIDRDPVTDADAQFDEGVGGARDLVLELGIGDRAAVAGLALEMDGDPVAMAGLDMTIDAVVRHIQPAVGEPLGERRVRPVQRLGRLHRPAQSAGLGGPEAQPVRLRLLIRFRRHIGGCRQLGRRSEPALLLQQVGQALVAHAVLLRRCTDVSRTQGPCPSSPVPGLADKGHPATMV
jgi:hypothetical protein